MGELNPQAPIPCPYHRFCKGHMDPLRPTQDNLCPECFELICDGHEQVELEEYAEQMAAESRGEVYVAWWEKLPSAKA